MQNQDAGKPEEMQLEDGITIHELEQRTEMFYCCEGSTPGPSCGSGTKPS